ncbi:hypothetical protein Tco_0737631, partial [Tanacetum coccineum]
MSRRIISESKKHFALWPIPNDHKLKYACESRDGKDPMRIHIKNQVLGDNKESKENAEATMISYLQEDAKSFKLQKNSTISLEHIALISVTKLILDGLSMDDLYKKLEGHQGIRGIEMNERCYQANQNQWRDSSANALDCSRWDRLGYDWSFWNEEGTHRPLPLMAHLSSGSSSSSSSDSKLSVSRMESTASKSSKDSLEQPKDVWPNAPIIESGESDSDDDCVINLSIEQNKPSYCFQPFNKDYDFHDNKIVEKPVLNNKGKVTGQKKITPVWNNAQRVNHQNKLTHPHPKRNFIPTAVATKSGQVPVNAAKQSSPRAATSISTARPVNTDAPKPKVNDALPITYSYFKAHSPVIRTFNQKSAAKINNFKEKVNTARVNNITTAGLKAVVSAAKGNGENAVKSSACWIWRPTGNVIDHISKDSGSYMLKRFDYGNPQYTLQDQGIFDSECSRHMTGIMSFLTNYQEIDGRFVAFGGSPKGGKITRKGKIRTGKLDFEDVYFVKELKFNLFSVSQMCDKKNSVLFTETECLVLSPDFKLLDESQVLLKVPRHDNMYSFDLKNVVPSG